MNNENLNIEDIRNKCNTVINSLLDIYTINYESVVKQTNDMLRIAKDELNKKIKRYNSNNDFWMKLGYAVKLGLNFFAIHLLGVEHEFLDFESYKVEKVNQLSSDENLSLTDDSINMIMIRIFEGIIRSLKNLKIKIENDNKMLLMFYKNVVCDVAYKRTSFHSSYFEFLNNTDMADYISRKDRSYLFFSGNPSGYSKNNIIENNIIDIVNNRKIENCRGR